MIHVVSVSGGKDSTAMWLWALRTGLSPLVPLFCDTKWEADKDGINTYAYLDTLERLIGPIRRVVSEGFEERTLRGGTFPSRARKWCSPELKVEMCAAELLKIRDEFNDDVEVLLGIRHDESEAREKAVEREWSKDYDCEVWRPILNWTVDDVIAEHHRAGVPLNPLYLAGANRVGCWPCIHAGKTELRMLGELDPERVERVARIEREVGQTMFTLEESRKGGKERKKIPVGIHEAVTWARTEFGGRQLTMIPQASGCFRWATCERPQADDAVARGSGVSTS
jgi:3'-phosphoadenosine 5'-phosphosulfate sulfotransferase (PAPS reductase)/FAD synthetase